MPRIAREACKSCYTKDCHCSCETCRKIDKPASSDDDYVAWLCFRGRGDQVWLKICNSDTPGAFKVFRQPVFDIESAVNRFRGWRLPETFTPDAGISFARKEVARFGMPTGTNLLDATQARAMVEYILQAKVSRPETAGLGRTLDSW